MSSFDSRFKMLQHPSLHSCLQLLKGLEKESLRVDAHGRLAMSPHPRDLGSALTHPFITTDYSESLLEFITAPAHSTDVILSQLDEIHRFIYQVMPENEMLWVASMPCQLPPDSEIPVARYGDSHVGRMKTIYREGLGLRYGRSMQTIAGVHYNFSLCDAFWEVAHQQEGGDESLQTFKNRRYFDLIRNFRRHFWLLLYLFGASPSVCRSFLRNKAHQLKPLGMDEHTLYSPMATCLRMGDLGYQSAAQGQLQVSYNDLDSYARTLCEAIMRPWPAYQALGVKQADGHYRQLNAGLLQIENEFYSTIRPKRAPESGQTPLNALKQKGVDYIEVRCIDLDPFSPVGVSAPQLHFIDVFLLTCLLMESPPTSSADYCHELENQSLMVYQGRSPALRLWGDSGQMELQALTAPLFSKMTKVADLLGEAHGTDVFAQAVAACRALLAEPDATPSARILQGMSEGQQTFARYVSELSRGHAQAYREHPLNAEDFARWLQIASASRQRQQAIEAQDVGSFDAYLARYYQQYECALSAKK